MIFFSPRYQRISRHTLKKPFQIQNLPSKSMQMSNLNICRSASKSKKWTMKRFHMLLQANHFTEQKREISNTGTHWGQYYFEFEFEFEFEFVFEFEFEFELESKKWMTKRFHMLLQANHFTEQKRETSNTGTQWGQYQYLHLILNFSQKFVSKLIYFR